MLYYRARYRVMKKAAACSNMATAIFPVITNPTGSSRIRRPTSAQHFVIGSSNWYVTLPASDLPLNITSGPRDCLGKKPSPIYLEYNFNGEQPCLFPLQICFDIDLLSPNGKEWWGRRQDVELHAHAQFKMKPPSECNHKSLVLGWIGYVWQGIPTSKGTNLVKCL